MKYLIKTIAILTAIILCLILAGCGSDKTESMQTGKTSGPIDSKDRVVTYQIIGMQNIGSMDQNKTVFKYDGDKEEWEEQPIILGNAVCPKCGATFRIQPKIEKEHYGDDTYVYSNDACCTRDHEDRFFNGYFGYSVMYQKIEEK